MKIGIKYCGGCNCHYDRTKEVEKLKKQFPQHSFTYQTDQEICDVCLLVCGCMTACASSDGIAAKKFELLCTPSQFAKFAAALKKEEPSIQQAVKTCIEPGAAASWQKTITAADIQTFASLTGNHGKIYTDAAFAAQCGFKRPLIPPSLLESTLSALLEERLTGNGAVLTSCSLQFPLPAYAGDTLTASATVTEIRSHAQGYEAKLHGICTNQHQHVVAEGTFYQLLSKKLFTCQE